MSKLKHYPGKYAFWMWLAWIIFVATAITSAIMISRTGVLQVSTGIGSAGMPPAAVTVLAIYVGQTVAALLLAGGFTILNGIYDATVESRDK